MAQVPPDEPEKLLAALRAVKKADMEGKLLTLAKLANREEDQRRARAFKEI